ncbi:cationic amino acid transporter 2-like protein [Dinothrombium tinctorium]|uniref:Cationic amino acid transporter 2-like protein n=1 Tax=Dinothrombium tinctorium TaxID=1965070 RepID=A0A443RQT2_9ACAR|nr:cationic amino acid transporter 2-like protein [Dinothrombium tinctorium]
MNIKSVGKALVRRKKIEGGMTSTKLQRCLNTLDLTALGIGSTLGLGMYVLAGQVASTISGPSVILSFFFAAVASVFAGLCYAEFGALVPRAGSAYVYSYVTVGELIAFVIGWNLILEYVIGTASVARGYSGYIDSIIGGTIQKHLQQWMPMSIHGFAEYPDFLAFGITLLLTIMLAVGVKESTRFNSIFTCINLWVVLYVVICGAFKADFHNWNLSSKEVPPNAGSGGFMPWGFSGMMQGAATCFYSFIGFDVIATTGEEVKNPQKAIPISIVVSLTCIFLAYFGISAVQTLMWPYYDQNEPAPLPHVFQLVGWPVAKWIISVGALAGLSTSLLGAMFPLPRVLYAMASDGLIYRCLADVHPRFKTPLLATIISGVFAGGMAAIFNVKELADMMSIGTLLAYTLVATSPKSEHSPIFSLVFWIVILDILLIVLETELFNLNSYAIGGVSCPLMIIIILTLALNRQPRNQRQVSFQVPWVPFIPFLSIIINTYLMLKLSSLTWIRFAVWMALGKINF